MNPDHKQILAAALKKEDFQAAFQEYLDWVDTIRSKKPEEAIKLLQEVIGLEAHYAKRNFLLDRQTPLAVKFKAHFAKFSPLFYERLGELYAEKKEHGKAVEALNKAVELSPSNTKAYLLLGISYLEKGLPDKAKGSFQEVVRFQGPEMALAFEKLAEVYASQGNTAQTIIWLKAAAETYLKKDELHPAIRALEKILEKEPENQEIMARVGDLYSRDGNVQEAVRVFKKLAEIYSKTGAFDKVIGLYEKLAEWEPDNRETIQKLIEIYRKSLQVDPNNIRIHMKLIENLLRQGSVEDVVSEYLCLIDNYMKMGLWEEAIHCCEKVLSFESGNLKAREMLADLYERSGNLEKAGKEFVLLAESFQNIGEEEKAGSFYRKAVNLGANQSEVRILIAKSLRQKGETEEAVLQFQEVLKEHPEEPESLWEMGNIFLAKQQFAKSEEFFQRLLQLQPDRLAVQEKLMEVYEAQLLREVEEPGCFAR